MRFQFVYKYFGIAIDFHGRVHKPMAKILAKKLEEFDPMFIEEPVLCENMEVFKEIAVACNIPIATGERLFTKYDFKRLLQAGGVDIIQPDLSHAGGLTEVKKIASMAEAYDVALAPHTAYSTLENLKDAQSNDYKLISKLNPSIIKGTRSEDGFIFNKDADTMQCPAGHLAIKYRIDKRSNQKKNTRIKYFFDINKCHVCPYRNGCYKENAKNKTYSITIKSDYHKNQEAFQKTQYFKERFKTRYMIEAKNSELKNIHGYSRCDAAGLSNMQLQGAVSIFAVNLRRILKLKGEVCPNEEK